MKKKSSNSKPYLIQTSNLDKGSKSNIHARKSNLRRASSIHAGIKFNPMSPKDIFVKKSSRIIRLPNSSKHSEIFDDPNHLAAFRSHSNTPLMLANTPNL